MAYFNYHAKAKNLIKTNHLIAVTIFEKYHHIYPNKDETSRIDIVYVCEKYHGNMKLQEEEVSKIEWFNKENVPENISINHQDPIKDYFKTFE